MHVLTSFKSFVIYILHHFIFHPVAITLDLGKIVTILYLCLMIIYTKLYNEINCISS